MESKTETNTELLRLIECVDNDIRNIWEDVILPYKNNEKSQVLDAINYDLFYDYMMENSPICQVITNNLDK